MKISNITKKRILILLIIICFLSFCVCLWLNSYIIHHIIFSAFNAPKYINLSREDGKPRKWVCNEEKMQFVAEDYISPESYVEIELANGTLITEEGNEAELYIEFEAESFYFTIYIEDDDYYGIGYYDYNEGDKENYRMVFNNKNWPKEYFGDENRELVFTLEE